MSNQPWESLKDMVVRPLCVPVHAGSWPLIAGAAALSVMLSFFSTALGVAGLAATAALYGASRDPKRVIPARENIVLAPCDGVVQEIAKYTGLPLDLDRAASVEETYTRISIAPSIFDVQMHRIPISGVVRQTLSMPGTVRDDDASSAAAALDDNPRALTLAADDAGNEYALCQIMNRALNRIEQIAREGDRLLAGDRMGMARVARRVDVYLPGDMPVAVAEGQRVLAGETILADRANTRGDIETRVV